MRAHSSQGRRVFVRYLKKIACVASGSALEAGVFAFFSQQGCRVSSVCLVVDEKRKTCRGFAFVYLESDQDVAKALLLHGTEAPLLTEGDKKLCVERRRAKFDPIHIDEACLHAFVKSGDTRPGHAPMGNTFVAYKEASESEEDTIAVKAARVFSCPAYLDTREVKGGFGASLTPVRVDLDPTLESQAKQVEEVEAGAPARGVGQGEAAGGRSQAKCGQSSLSTASSARTDDGATEDTDEKSDGDSSVSRLRGEGNAAGPWEEALKKALSNSTRRHRKKLRQIESISRKGLADQAITKEQADLFARRDEVMAVADVLERVWALCEELASGRKSWDAVMAVSIGRTLKKSRRNLSQLEAHGDQSLVDRRRAIAAAMRSELGALHSRVEADAGGLNPGER